jgi:gamma-glutamyltranspeptidase/glutathione hydrolase
VHTILPAMLLKEGQPAMIFGVVGAEFQSGGQVRVISGVVDSGLDVQQSLDLPRAWFGQGVVLAERGISESVVRQLSGFGHRVQEASGPLGAGQAIWIDQARSLFAGGSDQRKDGCAIGY